MHVWICFSQKVWEKSILSKFTYEVVFLFFSNQDNNMDCCRIFVQKFVYLKHWNFISSTYLLSTYFLPVSPTCCGQVNKITVFDNFKLVYWRLKYIIYILSPSVTSFSSFLFWVDANSSFSPLFLKLKNVIEYISETILIFPGTWRTCQSVKCYVNTLITLASSNFIWIFSLIVFVSLTLHCDTQGNWLG